MSFSLFGYNVWVEKKPGCVRVIYIVRNIKDKY